MFSINDLVLLKPELCLLGLSCIILVVDLFLSERTKFITYLLSQVAIVSSALLVWHSFDAFSTAFSGQFICDGVSQTLKLVMLGLVFFILMYSRRYCREFGMPRGEFHLLVLFSTLGMCILVSAQNLLVLYLGLELMALPLYVLVALNRDQAQSVEAAMKYFVMGALASGFLLYGFSFLYGITGSLQIPEIAQALMKLDEGQLSISLFACVFIIAGLAFKFGLVPFHMWVPDVYQGAPVNATLFISSAPKVAAFGMAYRLLNDLFAPLSANWMNFCLALAIASLLIGNVVAIRQTSIRRLFAYSTVAHVGYIFLALMASVKVGYSAALYYVVAYAITAAAGFGVILLMSQDGKNIDALDDFKGLAKRSPWLAFLMMMVAFSLAGVPPTVGFYAKLAIIQALLDASMVWVALVAMAFAIVGAYYYLKIIRLMYFEDPILPNPISGAFDVRVALSLHGVAILLFGLIPAPLFVFCQQAFA